MSKIKTIAGALMNGALLAGMVFMGYEEASASYQQLESATQAEQKRFELKKQAEKIALYEAQIECLAQNIYFEGQSEALIAQEAIAWVTLNRVHDEKYPDTVCDVVWQDSQFSWTHDGKSDNVDADDENWQTARKLAHRVYQIYGLSPDPTEGAVMFHADYVSPKWRKSYERTVQIDTHIFYRETEEMP